MRGSSPVPVLCGSRGGRGRLAESLSSFPPLRLPRPPPSLFSSLPGGVGARGAPLPRRNFSRRFAAPRVATARCPLPMKRKGKKKSEKGEGRRHEGPASVLFKAANVSPFSPYPPRGFAGEKPPGAGGGRSGRGAPSRAPSCAPSPPPLPVPRFAPDGAVVRPWVLFVVRSVAVWLNSALRYCFSRYLRRVHQLANYQKPVNAGHWFENLSSKGATNKSRRAPET